MSSPDTFDRQFRRTARSLRRRPNPKNWDRIEQRLDRRGGGSTRILGLRPWMIAAVLLLVAGYAALTALPTTPNCDVLAQRAQSMEDLRFDGATPTTIRIAPYAPLQDGRADGTLVSRNEPSGRLTVAPKYRL
ncbi:hypothetical protein [Neolewinella sp.]|uniref:hypothetical protein n=1 Tax=Neolewinella sp. TaxID=2993543 RepID=UPI003B519FD5